MDQGGDEDDIISTPPGEMTPITANESTRGACDGAKPMMDDRVTAKLVELGAMECGEQRRQVIREWTQQEVQIELASAKLRKVFSSHNNGIQSTVSRIQNFQLNTNDAVSLNLGELLQLEALQTNLSDRFNCMTTEWDIRRTNPEAELAFSEVENCIGIATRAVEKALRDSHAFLEVQYLTELELHRFDEPVLDEAIVNCRVNEEISSTLGDREGQINNSRRARTPLKPGQQVLVQNTKTEQWDQQAIVEKGPRGRKSGGAYTVIIDGKRQVRKRRFIRPHAVDGTETPIQSLAPQSQGGPGQEKVPEWRRDKGSGVALSQEIWPHPNTWHPCASADAGAQHKQSKPCFPQL